MDWRHAIAVVLLTVLVGLTGSEAVCAIVCDSASSAVETHHGSGQKCEEHARASNAPQMSGHSEHDCSAHDRAIRQAAIAAERADATSKSAQLAIGTVQVGSHLLHDSQAIDDSNAPPGTAPPTTTPLVLRI